jgi:hypothetical protein
MSYTKSEWRISCNNKRIVLTNEYKICTINNRLDPSLSETIEANTKLIVAAPLLLETLIRVVNHYAPDALTCPYYDLYTNSTTNIVLREARYAISKATGGPR